MSLSFNYGFGYIPRYSSAVLSTTVETSYIQVKVYPLFNRKVIVEWSIPSTWGNCSFNVYKSQTDDGEWDKVNPAPLVGTNFLEDVTTQDFSKFHRSKYIVEVQLPAPDGRFIKSPITTWENVRSNLMQIRAAEITRRESILLDKFTGVDTLIFRRKYFGQRCPQCWNTDTEKVTQDHCPTCLGTSFLGGYFPGVASKVCYEISPNNTQLTYVGKMETNNTSAWTISYPEVMTLDLLIRVPDFKIFRIQAVNATELQTVQVRQIMQLIELGKNSVEMLLLNNLVPNSFVNPKLLGSASTTVAGYIL